MFQQESICKQCNQPILFSLDDNRWKCDSCFSEFEWGEIIPKAKEVEVDLPISSITMCSYSCTLCGLNWTCDSSHFADSCLICKNTYLVRTENNIDLNANWLIPFNVDIVEVKKLFLKWKMQYNLISRLFSRSNELQNIRKAYVPAILFKGSLFGEINNSTNRTCSFRRVPIMSYSLFNESSFWGVEACDFSKVRRMLESDKQDSFFLNLNLSYEQTLSIAKERIENHFISSVLPKVRDPQSMHIRSRNLQFDKIKSKNIYLPVYLLSYKFLGEDYLFVVNGQTGSVHGKVPSNTNENINLFIFIFLSVWFAMIIIFSFIL